MLISLDSFVCFYFDWFFKNTCFYEFTLFLFALYLILFIYFDYFLFGIGSSFFLFYYFDTLFLVCYIFLDDEFV